MHSLDLDPTGWNVYPRKPLPHAEQIRRVRSLLRKTRTEVIHRYDDLFGATKGRRECPLEVAVRRRLLEASLDAVSLLEASLAELERQEAMFYAPFKPGDRIVVDRVERGVTATFGPYLIIDILPNKRTRYSYDCVALTKEGAMYKTRGTARFGPSSVSAIRQSDVALNGAGQWEAEYYQRCANTSRHLAFTAGDLTMFEARGSPLRGRPHYHRKDRLDP
jgi:hypothetical protein